MVHLEEFYPHKGDMRKRKLSSDAMCPVCGFGTEELAHIFHDCLVKKRFWDLLGINLFFPTSPRSWIEGLTGYVESVSNNQASFICYALWTL